MLHHIKTIWQVLDQHEKRRGLLCLAIMFFVALVETAGVASIMPFVAALNNPEQVMASKYGTLVADMLGYTDPFELLFVIGVITTVVLVSSLVLQAFSFYAITTYTNNRLVGISCRLFETYLGQPYEWVIARNTSGLSSTILEEVNKFVHNGLASILHFIANSTIALFILALLITVDPKLALMCFGTIGIMYLIMYVRIKPIVERLGWRRQLAMRGRFRAIHQSFGSVKTVKITSAEPFFHNAFKRESEELAKAMTRTSIWSEFPSFAIQGALYVGIMVLLLYMVRDYGRFEKALPFAAMYAFAAYRLMPSVQRAYSSASLLKSTTASIELVGKDLIALGADALKNGSNTGDAFKFLGRIEIDKVTFRYPSATDDALDNISLEIGKGQSIGVVGSTGCGKSTLVDVILGLLTATSGVIRVDGTPIDKRNISAWQRTIGYVPQEIYLSDDSIAFNIAFGIEPSKIDMEWLVDCAKIARIHDFIRNDLPDGYETSVGERGVRLSGGQLQRIGIARALYRRPQILLFDEATSALDNVTEAQVMQSIEDLRDDKTIIVVAHRLSTVKNCDRIVLLERGQIAEEGTYDALSKNSGAFSRLAKASS